MHPRERLRLRPACRTPGKLDERRRQPLERDEERKKGARREQPRIPLPRRETAVGMTVQQQPLEVRELRSPQCPPIEHVAPRRTGGARHARNLHRARRLAPPDDVPLVRQDRLCECLELKRLPRRQEKARMATAARVAGAGHAHDARGVADGRIGIQGGESVTERLEARPPARKGSRGQVRVPPVEREAPAREHGGRGRREARAGEERESPRQRLVRWRSRHLGICRAVVVEVDEQRSERQEPPVAPPPTEAVDGDVEVLLPHERRSCLHERPRPVAPLAFLGPREHGDDAPAVARVEVLEEETTLLAQLRRLLLAVFGHTTPLGWPGAA